jgi:hypothetical protein
MNSRFGIASGTVCYVTINSNLESMSLSFLSWYDHINIALFLSLFIYLCIQRCQYFAVNSDKSWMT